MKATTIFFSAIAIFFASCSNTPESSSNDSLNKNSATNDSAKGSSGNTSSSNCYRYVNNKDSVVMNITEENGVISGTLVYNYFEKDKARGTIKGEMKGDMLIGEYTYLSEGMESVRAIAFKKMGKNFIEGYGESETVNGKDVFKDVNALDFSNSVLLSPYDCEK